MFPFELWWCSCLHSPPFLSKVFGKFLYERFWVRSSFATLYGEWVELQTKTNLWLNLDWIFLFFGYKETVTPKKKPRLLDASNFLFPERNRQEIRYLPVTSMGWSLGEGAIHSVETAILTTNLFQTVGDNACVRVCCLDV